MTSQVVSAIQAAFHGSTPMPYSSRDIKIPPKNPVHRNKKGHSPVKSLTREQLTHDNNSDSCDSEDNDTDSVATGRITYARSKPKFGNSIKLPAFTGAEKCEVWVNRFESVADLKGWTDEERLHEILPGLQGDAGEFVFNQLTRKTLRNYNKLINELKNRFGVIESSRTYKLQFSRRKQLPYETPEKFAADLKRLYDKAYKRRDARTRQEDLLQRFLLGLYDYKARIHLELNRDPLTIEEAVYEVVTYTKTMKNPNSGEENNKRSVRQIKKAQENDSPNDQKNSKPSFTKPKRLHPNLTHASSDSKAVTINESDLLTLFNKMIEEKKHELNFKPPNKPDQSNRNNTSFNSGFKKPTFCYSGGQPGHIARNCISKTYDRPNIKPVPNPKFQYTGDRSLNPNSRVKTCFFKSTPNDSSRCSNITVCSDKLNDRETFKRDKTEYLKIDSSKEVQEAPCSSGVCPPVDTEVKDLPIQCSKSILGSETCVDKEPLHKSGNGPLTLSSISENDTGNFDIIGRQILKSEGVYIENTNVVFIADTGATKTVISTKVFKKIPHANRRE
ncbi:unnamed protein product [Mytilus coruscus]|uniref:CCHC-type domain-containing protein n=1 Tax=Mytilus coruscus TaxID=42192 RepID=A0A6J8AJR9_MYTCO|nr:unnamed protein product [Mytilus coruscus]